MWIPLLPNTPQPRYLALVEAIAEAIECGELKVGDRLPPQRRLAWALGLNPSTTQQAYREAAARHLVSGEVGRCDTVDARFFVLVSCEFACSEQ